MTVTSVNPARPDDVVATHPAGTAADVDRAVAAATARSTSAAVPAGFVATTSSGRAGFTEVTVISSSCAGGRIRVFRAL